VPPFDDLHRPSISEAMRAKVRDEFAAIPEYKRGAVLVIADETGVRGHVAARLDSGWKVAAGGGFNYGERRPSGYLAIEFAF
jgi:hypothetical protein